MKVTTSLLLMIAAVALRVVPALAAPFRGQSPNGQFYNRKVEWLGVGAHLYF